MQTVNLPMQWRRALQRETLCQEASAVYLPHCLPVDMRERQYHILIDSAAKHAAQTYSQRLLQGDDERCRTRVRQLIVVNQSRYRSRYAVERCSALTLAYKPCL